MTKEELIKAIADSTEIEKETVQKTVEAFMVTVENSMISGRNIYLRGFGSFVIKKRAKKTARNISKNSVIIIPAGNVPTFKPSEIFVNKIKTRKPKSSTGTDDDGAGYKQ
jgi:DNA-binding protein HU-beta